MVVQSHLLWEKPTCAISNRANSERIFYIRHAMRAGMTVDQIFQLTKIDPWFLTQMREIVDLEEELAASAGK